VKEFQNNLYRVRVGLQRKVLSVDLLSQDDPGSSREVFVRAMNPHHAHQKALNIVRTRARTVRREALQRRALLAAVFQRFVESTTQKQFSEWLKTEMSK